MPNEYGYGYHRLEYSTCPNCGVPTERDNIIGRGGGAHVRRCPRCAPPWGPVVGTTSLFVTLFAALAWLGYLILSAGLLLAVGLTVAVVVLEAINYYPRWSE